MELVIRYGNINISKQQSESSSIELSEQQQKWRLKNYGKFQVVVRTSVINRIS